MASPRGAPAQIANGNLGNQHRYAKYTQGDDVADKKRTAAVFPDEVGKTLKVAQARGNHGQGPY